MHGRAAARRVAIAISRAAASVAPRQQLASLASAAASRRLVSARSVPVRAQVNLLVPARFASGKPNLPAPGRVLGLPALSPTMSAGTIAEWKVKEGDKVAVGDQLALIETDKATVSMDSQDEGFVAKILKPKGSSDVPVSEPIIIIAENAEDVAKFKNFQLPTGGASAAAPAPKPAETATPAAAPAPASAPAAPRASGKPKLPAPARVLGLPALSPTMSAGTISEWKVKVGDKVAVGDQLAMIETDKATVSMDSQDEGFIAKILKPKGASDVPVSEPIIIIAENAEDVAKFADFDLPAGGDLAAAAAAAPAAAESAPAATRAAAGGAAAAAGGERVFASPAARKLATDKGVGLAGIQGSGPAPTHRVIKADVERAMQAAPAQQPAAAAPQPSAAAPAAAPRAAVPPAGAYTDVPLTNMRKVIAQRLTESKQQIPHYYLTVDVEMDAIMKVRAQLNAHLGKDGVKVSVNDFVVKAAALALRRVPTVNNSWLGTAMRVNHTVDVSVAVQTETGLITPIVRNADLRGVADIAAATKDLAERARGNKLALDEFQGGTFTISNLGMFGIKQFTAVINPPQSCILAVGAAQRRVVPADGEGPDTKIASVMTVTLSCDHRVVDGAVGAQWLSVFRGLLEKPITMLL